MTLDEFCTEKNIKNCDASPHFDVSPQCFGMWRNKLRTPSPEKIYAIDEWTNGQVTLSDFVNTEAA